MFTNKANNNAYSSGILNIAGNTNGGSTVDSLHNCPLECGLQLMGLAFLRVFINKANNNAYSSGILNGAGSTNGGSSSADGLHNCPLECGLQPMGLAFLRAHLVAFHGCEPDSVKVVNNTEGKVREVVVTISISCIQVFFYRAFFI
jgi:hypothetical protein